MGRNDIFRAFGTPGSKDVVDQFGRVIKVGDLVMSIGGNGVIWRVAEITPELDPRAPANALRVGLVATTMTLVQGGTATPALVKVQDGQIEQQQAQVDAMADQSPNGSSPKLVIPS